jgi:hypothetical protein
MAFPWLVGSIVNRNLIVAVGLDCGVLDQKLQVLDIPKDY